MALAAVPTAFDPWTSSEVQALRAHEQHDPAGGTADPLAQRQAALEVMACRDACLSAHGGCAVLRCVGLCLVNQLVAPPWLSDAYVQRHSQVVDAHVGSWDEAFNRPWPPRTRLDMVRRHRRLRQLVHAAVWDAVMTDPAVAINRILFEQVGETPGIDVGGRLAEDLYYEALREGSPNALQVRSAQRAA